MAGSADKDLAHRAVRDRAAADELISRVLGRVQRVVRFLVRADADADDLVNTALVEILESAAQYRGKGTLEAWAGAVAYRVTMRQLSRRRRREKTVVLDPGYRPFAEPPDQRPRSPVGLRERLAKHLQKLPPERRTTLVLRLVLGHSVDEVATITGVPKNTARDRIQTGLRELRKAIECDPALGDFLEEGRHVAG